MCPFVSVAWKHPKRVWHFGYEVFNKTGFNDWKHAYKSYIGNIGGLCNGNKTTCYSKFLKLERKCGNELNYLERLMNQNNYIKYV
jgi:hypothetical protein